MLFLLIVILETRLGFVKFIIYNTTAASAIMRSPDEWIFEAASTLKALKIGVYEKG